MPSEWMTKGRHPVDLGPSFVRALKTRAGGVAKPAKTKIPVNDFYSFRYKFKPESINDAKPGLVEAKSGDNIFRVERPSSQHDENHVFTATEKPARDWECVLILDEETGAFTLEKLDSLLDLAYDGRPGSRVSRVSSPRPSSPKAGGPSSPEVDMEDAEGEVDTELITVSELRAEEHEEEEEEEEVPLIDTTPVKQSAPAPKTNGTGKAGSTAKGKGKAKGKQGTRTAKAKVKKPKEESEPEETVWAPPTRPPARTRSSTTASNVRQKPPTRPLALPTNMPPKPSDILVPPPAAKQPFTSRYEGSSEGSVFASDSDADMEPVQPMPAAGEDIDQEIDPDEFALELDQNLMTDEETPGMEVDTFKPGAGTGPVSLNQYAGGQGAQDDDDYSSSEEDSDD